MIYRLTVFKRILLVERAEIFYWITEKQFRLCLCDPQRRGGLLCGVSVISTRRSDQYAHTCLGAKSQSDSLVGKNRLIVSKWRPF